MIATLIEWVAALSVLTGSVLGVLSALGLVRLPDLYLRSHAVAKGATLGVMLVLGGAFLYAWADRGIVSIKLLIGILFVLVTSPVAGHLTGRAAYRSGVPMWHRTVRDDLGPALRKERPHEEQENAASPRI